MKKKSNQKQQDDPEIISRNDADRLNDFAQDLDDVVTHVVDYGGLSDDSTLRKTDTDE